ncbi:MAG: M36 family metallopeptidase [Janthinobacterium lividum]
MPFFSTSLGYRMLALSAALTLPGLAAAQQAPTEALSYFAAKAKALGLSDADVAAPLVTDSYFDAGMGLTHTYLQQRVNGVPIFGATGDVHTDRNGQVVASSQAFVRGAAASAPSPLPSLSAADAVAAAARVLGLPQPVGLSVTDEGPTTPGVTYFSQAGISHNYIPVQLMYVRTATGLVLVWDVAIAQLNQEHYWNTRVDAHTGQLVDKNDYTVSEQATFRESMLRTEASRQQALDLSQVAALRNPTNTTAANSLTATAFPLESPSQGGRTAVALPAVGNTYSPYGWVAAQSPSTFTDIYSRISSGKTLTRGNNAAAYDDNNATVYGPTTANLYNNNSSPDGGATLNYDFPFNQIIGPRANLNAAITNLFYVGNMMHDVMQSHGFSEVAGNFQYKNATGTGQGNDPVRQEAQDGFGRNNANFSTPNDGLMPNMQMYLFDNITPVVTISAPSTIAGTYTYRGTTAFGGDIRQVTSLCANIVPVDDGTGIDGGIHSCASTYANAAAVSGNIALIQAGSCSTLGNAYIAKVRNAQLNGAIAAIVYDSNPTGTTYVTMGGTDPTITIPAVYISGVDGTKLRAGLTTGATGVGCITYRALNDWDGSLDNGVVAHEYGHGVSTRLTGGPANSSCVPQSYTDNGTSYVSQCPGEGWSDFFAIWMTTKVGDVGTGRRTIGTYVFGQATTGSGIRLYPYSTDMSIDPATYGRIANSPYTADAHAVGEVWTSVLWDLNWQFITKYGYNSDLLGTTGGNNQFLRLVLEGCKLQPCSPNFLQARNAILKADSLANLPAIYSPNRALIWAAFARRGMGYKAVGGTRSSTNVPTLNGITESFDLPPDLAALANRNATATNALEVYPNPATDRLLVRTQLNSSAPMQVTMLDLLGKTVLAPVAVPAAQMQQRGTNLDISELANGIYIVRVVTTEGTYTTKVTVQH